jgi:hypothetical protein
MFCARVVQKQTPGTIEGARFEVPELTPGRYRVVWWDTAGGAILTEHEARLEAGSLTLTAPSFAWDIACKITPVPD